MCPVCLTTAALTIAGATSAGGLITLALKMIRTPNDANYANPKPEPKEKSL